MNIEEYGYFTKRSRLVLAEDLTNKTDRTLLYGFTSQREDHSCYTHHVYIKDGVIHTVRYLLDGAVCEITVHDNDDYIPDKRVYPERSDFEFCLALSHADINIPFTTYDERTLKPPFKHLGPFYGEILP